MIEQLGLMVIALLMVGGMVYPFRHHTWAVIGFSLGLIVCLIAGYLSLGNHAKWQAYQTEQKKIAQAKAYMHRFKNTAEVIQALRARLDHTPASAKGWYLLGRLYASVGQWQDATPAFAEAHRLQPSDVMYWVQSVMSLSQGSPQQLSATQREQFKQILLIEPNQPEALMFLAADANVHHQPDLAIAYWTKLLSVLPDDAEEAVMIRQEIAKAEKTVGIREA
ncbi:MAG: tetratricopeptide repeat protein [Gammaproteobacteria bacterium]|nr:tetratricopeptide repeat protein [Gammaproteobacteria bacterium]